MFMKDETSKQPNAREKESRETTKWRNANTNKVPVIYTFYSPKLNVKGEKKDDGYEHDKLVHVWKTLWKEAGWDPKVLTLDDAKKHPDFVKYSDILLNSIYPHLCDQCYDTLCFLRWLAMAAHGSGGWTSDYDTFPMGITVETGINLPNNGRFTSYQVHIPALMSGSAEEWERVSHLVLDQVAIGKEGHLSDMMALKYVHDDDPESVLFEQRVFYGYPYKVNTIDKSNIVDCGILSEKNIWAIHLSHASTEKDINDHRLHISSDGNGMHDRHSFAWEISFLWKNECAPNLNLILGKIK